MTPADVIREQRMLLGRNRELQVLEGWTRHPMFPRPANPVIRDGVHQEFVTTFPGAVPFLWSPAMLG